MSAQNIPQTPLDKKSNAKNALEAPQGSRELSVSPAKKSGTHFPPQELTPVTLGEVSQEYQQIQRDELEVLQSAFMDDYKYIERPSAWNVSIIYTLHSVSFFPRCIVKCEPKVNNLHPYSQKTENEFKLRLKAPSDKEYLCILTVLMTATYPKTGQFDSRLH